MSEAEAEEDENTMDRPSVCGEACLMDQRFTVAKSQPKTYGGGGEWAYGLL